MLSVHAIPKSKCIRGHGTAAPTQPNLVPRNELKEMLANSIPVVGDQLFEERARNVIWTYWGGVMMYGRIELILNSWIGMSSTHSTRYSMLHGTEKSRGRTFII